MLRGPGANVRRRYLSFGLVVACTLTLPGCAALGLTAFSIAAGTGAGVGAGHVLDTITYKTFSLPLAAVSRATVLTLDRLDMPVMTVQDTEEGQTIEAQAGERAVEIELDRMTTNATRMRVVVKKNFLIRDRATATEIILQTEKTITDNPHLAAGRETKPAKPATRTTQRCAKGGPSC
jgi:hypothetical protein